MPAPGSHNARRLVQTVWDLFAQVGDWPTVGQVANRLDRQHDLAFEEALPDVMPSSAKTLDRISVSQKRLGRHAADVHAGTTKGRPLDQHHAGACLTGPALL